MICAFVAPNGIFGLIIIRASPPAIDQLEAGFLAFSYQLHVFIALVADLLALQYSDRLGGLLALVLLLFIFWFAKFLCWNVCWHAGFWI